MSDKSDTPRTDAAEAWLITCRGPGRSLTYATVDKNDTLHWPLDQWATVETVSLVRESELAAVTEERDALAAAIKLKASGLYKLREGLAECRAECERLREDAERYRWFRRAWPPRGAERDMDAAIDAARNP